MDPYGRLKEATKWMWALGDYRELARFLEPHAEALAKAAAVQPGMDVLDVAAGNGNFAIAAAKSGANVTATDLTPKMIELGRLRTDAANLGVEWREADAEALPFAGERFDLVWSRWPTIPPAGLALPAPFDWGDPSVTVDGSLAWRRRWMSSREW